MKRTLLKKLFKYLRINEQDQVRLCIVSAVFFAVFLFYHFDLLKRFELVTYDTRWALKGVRASHPDVVVIEISDDSIAKIGRWPWGRDWHAALIKILDELGAKAIVFDVIFSEPSDPAKDVALAQAIEQSKKVYLAEVADEEGSAKKTKLLTSVPEFARNAKGSGHINLQPDIDGVMRRIPLVFNSGNILLPQLSLAVALDVYGATMKDIRVKENNFFILLKNGRELRVPLDAQGNFIIHWAGKWREAFKHYSYVEVVGSYAIYKKGGVPKVPMSDFKNKICYIGTTAAGLYDIRPTPLEPSYPAVGVNLTVLDDLLQKRFIHTLSYGQNLWVLFFLGLILLFIMKQESYFKVALFTASVITGFTAVAILLFIYFDVWVNIVYPMFLTALTYFFVTVYNQLSVAIEKARLMKLATRDSLTGLYNIGHFKLLLTAEIATIAVRREKNLSLLMSDVDNFKKTNDTYGHVTGDRVLWEVAAAIKSTCRALDVPARYGGEEFIVMLPGASVDDAHKVAEKIRKSVEQKVFFHEKGDFSTSISLGVTQISPDETNLENIVARADRALYEAKQTGKNKAVIASDSPKFELSLMS